MVDVPDRSGPGSTQRDYSILYIEDEAADVALLKAVLADESMTNYTVRATGSIRAAESLLFDAESAPQFDVILLDLSLPDAAGISAIETLSMLNLDVPIIVMTGNDDQLLPSTALQKGAQDYLVKGCYSLETLSRTIKYAVERSNFQKALHDLAHTDMLTQLPNRLSLNSYLDMLLTRARRQQFRASVLFIDFDNFKHINDTHGHRAGDRFLQEVAARLKSQLRASDFIARLGGDEFVVVIEHNEKWLNGIITVLDSLITSLARPFAIDDCGLKVQSSSSIGVAEYHWLTEGLDTEALCHQADVAMYRAKQKSGNCYQFYNTEIEKEASQRARLMTGLETALKQREFQLFYQPVVSALDGSWVGVEALLRWQPAGQQLVAPAEFIHLLEETNKIIEVGEWVLHQACRDYRTLVASGVLAQGAQVSVNVSPSQFLRSDFLDTVKQAILASDIAPCCLQLEITETLQVDQPGKMIHVLNLLKKSGVMLAIDDFGTGFSSMRYLKDMPIDTIKIDRSFVQSYLCEESDRLIVDAMIGLGKQLGKQTVVEGVETQAVVEALQASGCDRFQGYHFAHPMPVSELLEQAPKLLCSAPAIRRLSHG